METRDIIFETSKFRLTIGEDCTAKSLIHKATGEECLAEGTSLPLFSVTQERPFNNEIKLAYPCKRTVFQAERVRQEGEFLIVGFRLVRYEAKVRVTVKADYLVFSLEEFLVYPGNFGHLRIDTPPASAFRLLQLPLRSRERFGQWMNSNWDDRVAVCVMAAAPETLVDMQPRENFRIFTADVRSDIEMKGPGAALIVDSPDTLLDTVACLEEDYNLPRGVASRRNDKINASIYWVYDLTPANLDEHIAFAKSGGFRMILLYYTCFFRGYRYTDAYPNGQEDLKMVLNKLKAAGLTPGFHFLQPHIGMDWPLVTPVADHRLGLKKHFTLARPLGMEDTVIYVEQRTKNAVMADKCRVLQFGGELITYEGVAEAEPYCFTGCKRGAYGTTVTEHNRGQIGGIVDMSEYGAYSAYLDQKTSLSEDISQLLADTYNLGFEFLYYDGSEGTNLPYEYHIPEAQYHVYRKLDKAPRFAEGAAKAHFSWHMLSGGNAFDTFKADIFKEMIKVHPAPEADRMRNDFTRINFGWWRYWGTETQPDMFEYGTSRAAAWDCPITLQVHTDQFRMAPRFGDVFEVLRRWEDVRAAGWLTDAQKEELKNLEQEHILLVNEKKEFELVPYFKIEGAVSGEEFVTAYSFTRGEESYVVYWHHNDSVKVMLPLEEANLELVEELYSEPLAVETSENGVILPADHRRYIRSKLPVEKLIQAFRDAKKI